VVCFWFLSLCFTNSQVCGASKNFLLHLERLEGRGSSKYIKVDFRGF